MKKQTLYHLMGVIALFPATTFFIFSILDFSNWQMNWQSLLMFISGLSMFFLAYNFIQAGRETS